MEKKSCTFHRVIALVLALGMVLSMVACGRTETQSDDLLQNMATTETALNSETAQSEQSAQEEVTEDQEVASVSESTVQEVVIDNTDRESLEQIADILGNNVNTEKLDDESLNKLVEDLLQNLENDKKTEGIVNLENSDQAQTPEIVMDESVYDESGAMVVPFDQAYPELVESGAVEYDDETLLIKLKNSQNGKITAGMAAAGVVALEVIVPMEDTSWYEAKLKNGTDASAAIAALRELSEVLLVEYNYEIETAHMDSYKDLPGDKGFDKNGHHKDQWYMHYCGIPDAVAKMKTNGGSSSVIVAVIDSGVDYDHEDLADNIWVNTNEIPDNGKDDDGNGYIDDYYGVNIVTKKGNGDDDNGHGTHVAGIIAAENNNLGVVGIACNVTIMPVKAAMASGYLNQSDIAKAVLYAYENGAEVINMSFGGSACSIAVQDALATAYTRCVLVASAGNDGKPNEGDNCLPNYPAALTYVLGVMSVDRNGVESSFTNWDSYAYNGVEYELYAPGEAMMSTLPNNQYGYLSGTSMAAPVVSAMAAILRSEYSDRDAYPSKFIYGQLASTSGYDATCLDPDEHGEHNLPQIVNLNAALTQLPSPDVNLQDYALFDTVGLKNDTAGANTGEGVIDAGETIALGLTLRNRWGKSNDTVVKVTADNNGIEDPFIQVLNPSVNYGSVGTYSTQDCGAVYTDDIQTGWKDPFYIRISEDCPNDYIFTIKVTITCKNGLDSADKATYTNEAEIMLKVRSGKILPSVISEDMVLTTDSLYIIPNSTVILEGVTVRVEPGTHIQFWGSDKDDPYADNYISYLLVHGNLLVEGTKENPVYIYPSDLMDHYNVEIAQSNTGYISLKNADVTNLAICQNNSNYYNHISYAEGCTFRINYGTSMYYRYLSNGVVKTDNYGGFDMGSIDQMVNCAFYKIGNSSKATVRLRGSAINCIFVDCGFDFPGTLAYHTEPAQTPFTAQNCVFLGNRFQDQTSPKNYDNMSLTLMPSPLTGLSAGSVKVYYREETGTTYVTFPYYTGFGNVGTDFTGYYYGMDDGSVIARAFMECTGAEYLVIEDQAELDYLDGVLPSIGYLAGIYYDDAQGQYVFGDGSAIGEFMAPDGLWTVKKDGYTLMLQGRGQPSRPYTGLQYAALGVQASRDLIFEIPGDILPTELTFSLYEVVLDLNSQYQINAITKPAMLTADRFLYESSDEKVLTVSETGLVTPVGKGTADVRVSYLDGAVSNYITFKVGDYVALEGISFPEHSGELAIGGTLDLAVEYAPANTTRPFVSYTSSDPAVAVVNEYGVVTGVGSGKVTITATSSEKDKAGKAIKASVTLTVYRAATSLTLDAAGITAALADGAVALPNAILSEGAEAVLSWRSSDTAVAEVKNGQLVLKSEGTTALEVRDSRSGLSATCLVIVGKMTPSAVKEIYVSGTAHYVLLENGDFYFWGKTGIPQLTASDVVDFEADGSIVLLRFSSGKMEDYYINNTKTALTKNHTYDYFVGKELKGMGFGQYYCYAILPDGSVYSWTYSGNNSNGILGVGTTTPHEEPQMVMLEDVVDIYVDGSRSAFFLTGNGDVYVTGSGDTTPRLLASNIAQIYQGSSGYLFALTTSGENFMQQVSADSGTKDKGFSGYDSVSFHSNSYDGIGIRDGKVYRLNWFNSKEPLLIPGISDAVMVYTYEDMFYVVTERGLLYAFGKNSTSNHTGGMSTGSVIDTPVLIPIEPLPAEEITVLSTNLKDGKLSNDTLQIEFNKAINSVSAKLYKDGTQSVATTSVENLNRVVLSKASGFEGSGTYELVFEAGSILAAGGVTNAEAISISFTYAGQQNEQAGEDGKVVVVHESVFDPEVQRHRTAESIATAFRALLDEQQINPYFYHNVILNRVSTDTDVTHWLRIQGPETKEYTAMPLGGNYWGTVNENTIGLQIVDYSDFISYAHLVSSPYLTEIPENTFPFVTGVTILNKAGEAVKTVSNEKITVRITFNRDMDTSIPLQVCFGSAYPYADYEISLGSYVNARTWEGEYTLSTLIEGGKQYFTISNGCTADGSMDLFTDQARFGFVLDTTAAQAMLMQGNATATGIQLSWTQDDFETLMGYNVYRATSEDGLYSRINSTVIPADTMKFFDDTVEPGTMYYYNFTVVKTDLSESIPSGKIALMSLDTMAPDIYHSQVYNAVTGSNLIISATVTDNLNIVHSKVFYRTTGTSKWKAVQMNNLNDKYSAIIPAADVTTAGLEYYIEAYDGISYTYKGSADAPYSVTVQEAVDKNALGDVNGDGRISNLDALMVLQAINDQLNLDAAQFARADLDGNGNLEAKEVLRILQYINGTVGSVAM